MILSPYAKTAKHYAEAVVAGEIPARRWVKLACQRQLDELARLKGKAVACRFNPKLRDQEGRAFHPADNLCAFIGRLPYVKARPNRAMSWPKRAHEPWPGRRPFAPKGALLAATFPRPGSRDSAILVFLSHRQEPIMRKRFPCGHRGRGQYCHRCAQERGGAHRRAAAREGRLALAELLGVPATDFPDKILRRAAAIHQEVAAQGLLALRRRGAKKILSLDNVLSVPVGHHHRLLFVVDHDIPRYLELLTHEQYDRRLVVLCRSR